MELPYDGDTNNPSQYCKHGTFIGSWWGPDYLCQACEDGEPAYEPTFDENATVTVAQMISEAAGLMLDGSEPEYLRALVELIVRCTPGLTHDDDVVIAGRISEAVKENHDAEFDRELERQERDRECDQLNRLR